MHKPPTIVFVINPISGGSPKKNWEEAIRETLGSEPIEPVFCLLSGEGDRQAIQQCIEKVCPDKVVAVGGDGTVKLVAEAIKESTILLGIIPAGSANGMAKELNIPSVLSEALTIILKGKEGKLDAVRINEEELCFHLSDAGLNASLVKYYEDHDGRGMWGYARSVFKMFWNKRQMRVSIKTDNETVKRKAFMVMIANAEKYGTGAVINPDGRSDDGLFEVVVVRKIKLSEIIKAITAHKNFNPENIEIFRTKNASLVFQQKAPFQIDGEFRGKTARIDARILPGIVSVMLPA